MPLYNPVVVASLGDVNETSFTAADNQVAAANVTSLVFSNTITRSFIALVSVTRGATYSHSELHGVQKGAAWEMSETLTGDATGITFTITTAGQVQFTSSSTGSTATIKFRALTTKV